MLRSFSCAVCAGRGRGWASLGAGIVCLYNASSAATRHHRHHRIRLAEWLLRILRFFGFFCFLVLNAFAFQGASGVAVSPVERVCITDDASLALLCSFRLVVCFALACARRDVVAWSGRRERAVVDGTDTPHD